MRQRSLIIKISLFSGIVSWIALLVTDLLVFFGSQHNMPSGIPEEARYLLFDIFIISLFFYYNKTTGSAERINFIDLLWRVFVMGLLAAIVFLLVMAFYQLLEGTRLEKDNYLFIIFFNIILGLSIAFLVSTIVVWKQLILYQKSKRLINSWQLFEYTLLISIFFNFFTTRESINQLILPLAILLILGIILSINLKWIAYLDYKKKWKSIFLVLGIGMFLGFALKNLFELSSPDEQQILTNLPYDRNVFLLASFGFALNYCIFSLLVLFFNLPTSSVFEQKLEEVMNFQRLSQSTQQGYKVDQVYEILLESTIRAVLADAAWVEINNDQKNGQLLLTRNIEKEEVKNIQHYFQTNKRTIDPLKITGSHSRGTDRRFFDSKRVDTLQAPGYRSVLWIPLIVKHLPIGVLVVLKEVADGFNKEMVSIVGTFATQASISIENLNLLDETLENERYREELKIASRVQKSLLPKKPIFNEAFELTAFSEAADQVGGDYYDMYQVDTQKFIIAIGDVSGKGTSAAFNMSQMKGVFHSLVQLDFHPDEFLIHANSALSRCLEKSSFITATVLAINTQNNTVEIARAGHCPTLFYSNARNEAIYFEGEGMGLGIIRDVTFEKYVEVIKISYQSDDVIVLYTDGITEATNEQNEQFGYERLQCLLNKNAALEPNDLKQTLIQAVFEFCGQKVLDDDYTIVIIKFK